MCSSANFISRVCSLIRYHKFSQISHRVFKRLATPVKHIAFSFYFKHRSNTRSELRGTLPRAHDFPDQIIPLQKVPSKYPHLDSSFLDTFKLPRLKQFEIHSHRFLVTQEPKESLWLDVINWISKFPLKQHKSYKTTWHPYVCTKRIQHWLALWIRLPPPSELHAQLLSSLYQQLHWLEKNLETDIGGNHLWENAQSLILGGSFFEGDQANRWLDLGLNQLKSCLHNQLLPHGEHFEKSPSYHWELTNGLFFLLPWIKQTAPMDFDYFLSNANKMFKFAQDITHPNGTLPYFNDSWETHLSPTQQDSNQWTGDYFISRSESVFFVFDAGNLGEDSLPAHSHCDLLTFELSLNASPVMINSGTFCYEGPKRNLYRKSKAHNVLLINEKGSADIWSSFRMGQRGHVTQRQMMHTQNGTWIMATHDAYKSLGFPEVTRVWFVSESKTFLCSAHLIKTRHSEVTFQEYIHLHPEVRCSTLNQHLIINDKKQDYYFQPISPFQKFNLEKTFFSPQFDVEVSNQTIVICSQPTAETSRIMPVTAWSIAKCGSELNISLEVSGNQLKLNWQQDNERLQSIYPFSFL